MTSPNFIKIFCEKVIIWDELGGVAWVCLTRWNAADICLTVLVPHHCLFQVRVEVCRLRVELTGLWQFKVIALEMYPHVQKLEILLDLMMCLNSIKANLPYFYIIIDIELCCEINADLWIMYVSYIDLDTHIYTQQSTTDSKLNYSVVRVSVMEQVSAKIWVWFKAVLFWFHNRSLVKL